MKDRLAIPGGPPAGASFRPVETDDGLRGYLMT